MIPFAWMCVTADSTWSPKESHPDTKNLRLSCSFPSDVPACCMTCATQTSGMRFRDSLASPIHKSQMSTKKRQFLFSIKTKIKVKSLPLLLFVELRLFFFQKIAIHYICWEKRVTGHNSSGSPHRCAYEALHENNGPWPGHRVWNPGSPFPLKIQSKKESPT